MRRPSTPPLLALIHLLQAASSVRASLIYNIHGAVVLTRTGEKTPLLTLYNRSLTDQQAGLTPLGAQQAHAQGAALRQRYLSTTPDDAANLGPPVSIAGLSPHSLDNNQLYIAGTDDAYITATAQAFVQGLYPPSTTNRTASPALDTGAVLANGTSVDAPLGGYQYPNVRALSAQDPDSVFLSGTQNCVSYAHSVMDYLSGEEFEEMRDQTRALYRDVGAVMGLGDVLPVESWNYADAMAIAEYLEFLYLHDGGVREVVDGNGTVRAWFDEVRYLADQQAWTLFTSTSTTDSIRTIAGRTFLAKAVSLLQTTIATRGAQNKLSLLFADHPAFVSLFSLAALPKSDASDFYGLPLFASSLVFELYSFENDTSASASASGNEDGGEAQGANANLNANANTETVPIANASAPPSFPAEADLWLRFSFRNGTDQEQQMIAYPLFNRGPSETDVRWTDFLALVRGVVVEQVGEWCEECGAWSLFCDAFGVTGIVGDGGGVVSGGMEEEGEGRGGMSAGVAGVVGAATTVGVGLLVALALLLGAGWRVQRVEGGKWFGKGIVGGGGGGGFKGGAKMASDVDVRLAKSGAPVGVTLEEDTEAGAGVAGRERVGSWEMKGGFGEKKERGSFGYLSGSTAVGKEYGDGDGAGWGERASFENNERGEGQGDGDGDVVDPFSRPVEPVERV